jgi:hypothetical protein
VSTAWSIAEFGMMLLLGELLPADSITATAVSSGLDYSRRRDLLNSLAQFKLSKAKAEFDSVMSELGGLSKERNAVIHGLFSTIDGNSYRMNINNRGVLVMKESKESISRLIGLSDNIATLANKMPPLSARVRVDVTAWQEKHREAFAAPDLQLLAHPLAGRPNKR